MNYLHRGLCALVIVVGQTCGFADDAAALFNLNCAPCHSKDGTARTPAARKLGVKDLTQSKISDEDIARQIRDGRKGPDGKQQMPSFGERLSAADVKSLVQYVGKLRKAGAR